MTILALTLASALAADYGGATGAIELAGAYAPGYGIGYAGTLRGGIPIPLGNQDPLWQVVPEVSVRYASVGANLTHLGNLSFAIGGRGSAVVWEGNRRKNKKFKGRARFQQYAEAGALVHLGVGFDTQHQPTTLTTNGLSDPRAYGDLGVYGAFVTLHYTVGAQLTQALILPSATQTSSAPITTVGFYLELPIQRMLGML